MIYNALITVLFLLIPVIWSAKGKGFGLFTAMLASVCALASGAVAFAAWEPSAVMLMSLSKDSSSFVGNALQSHAYVLGLLVPYLLTLALMRVVVDSLVPANLEFDDLTNTIGGIVFGGIVSFITVGIIAVSFSYMPLGKPLMGYDPIEERNGSPVYASKLWIPLDTWTVALYQHLSGGVFANATPLAVHRPNPQVLGHLQRMTFEGATRNTWLPEHFSVLGVYTVPGSVASLLSDTFLVGPDGNPVKQPAAYLDGSSPAEGSSLQGYVLSINSGAKEKQGNSIMGVGQISLIVALQNGGSTIIQPISCIAPPEAGATSHYRFRFDATEVFIASRGGASETTFAFEFVVPPGATPLSLIVKNTRLDVNPATTKVKQATLASAAARDAAINDNSLFTTFGAGGGGLDGPVDTATSITIQKQGSSFDGVEVSRSLPEGMAMNKSNRGPLEVNEKNLIVGGEHSYSIEQLTERAVDKNLRVDTFFAPDDVGMIKIRLSSKGARSLLGRSVETAERVGAPLLVDEQGNTFEAVGFVYGEGDTVQIRYTPGRPIRALLETPALSRTKTDQTLWLIFLPTRGAKIKAFNVGNRQYAEYPGGIEAR